MYHIDNYHPPLRNQPELYPFQAYLHKLVRMWEILVILASMWEMVLGGLLPAMSVYNWKEMVSGYGHE